MTNRQFAAASPLPPAGAPPPPLIASVPSFPATFQPRTSHPPPPPPPRVLPPQVAPSSSSFTGIHPAAGFQLGVLQSGPGLGAGPQLGGSLPPPPPGAIPPGPPLRLRGGPPPPLAPAPPPPPSKPVSVQPTSVPPHELCQGCAQPEILFTQAAFSRATPQAAVPHPPPRASKRTFFNAKRSPAMPSKTSPILCGSGWAPPTAFAPPPRPPPKFLYSEFSGMCKGMFYHTSL